MKSRCFPVLVVLTLVISILNSISVSLAKEPSAQEARLNTTTPRSTALARVRLREANAKKWIDVEEILKDSGLSSDQRDKVVKRIREVFDGRREIQFFGYSGKGPKIESKAVVITADGKQQEVELTESRDHALRFVEVKATSSYMIGLNCKPVGDALRSQLRLGEGVGLVVESVADDTPADKAGIKRHDVLFSANDRDLSSIKDLTVTVQSAGKDKKDISLDLIRGGKERTVELTPIERKTLGVEGRYLFEDVKPILIRDVKPIRSLQLDWRRVEGLPGESEIKSLKNKVEKLEQQFRSLRRDLGGAKATEN